MKEKLQAIKEFRDKKEELEQKYSIAKASFEESVKHIVGSLNAAKDGLKIVENELREEALTQYRITGNKTFDFGVGIRVRNIIEYDDNAAFNWAKEHSLALSLDKKAFEAIAKAQDIPCVTRREEVTATIPTKIEV